MAADAKARGEKGWTVTLQAPSYVPFMTYSSNRALKEKLGAPTIRVRWAARTTTRRS